MYILIVVFQAHQWVLGNMDKWVEKYLIADNSLRIRNGKVYYEITMTKGL